MLLLLLLLAAVATAEIGQPGGRWVGPLPTFYNNTACRMLAVLGPLPEATALEQCIQKCCQLQPCNAMSYGTGMVCVHETMATRTRARMQIKCVIT